MALHPRQSRPITSRGQAADEASYDPDEVAQTDNPDKPPEIRRADGSLHYPESERPNPKADFGDDNRIVAGGQPDAGPDKT